MRKLSDQIEAFPDLFMRKDYLPKLTHVRSLLAELVGAQEREVVLVPNATHGVNNVVSQINWQDGDVVIMCEFTQVAMTLNTNAQIRQPTVPWRKQ